MWIWYILIIWAVIFIPVGIAILFIKGAAAIIYGSKVVFALLIALIVNSQHPLFENGFLSYLAWAAMDYQCDEESLRWKCRHMEYMLRSELAAYRKQD